MLYSDFFHSPLSCFYHIKMRIHLLMRRLSSTCSFHTISIISLYCLIFFLFVLAKILLFFKLNIALFLWSLIKDMLSSSFATDSLCLQAHWQIFFSRVADIKLVTVFVWLLVFTLSL